MGMDGMDVGPNRIGSNAVGNAGSAMGIGGRVGSSTVGQQGSRIGPTSGGSGGGGGGSVGGGGGSVGGGGDMLQRSKEHVLTEAKDGVSSVIS